MELIVKYVGDAYGDTGIMQNEGSDWIDLRANQDYHYAKGEEFLLDLGVCIKVPDGYEAHLAPRSSSFRKYHLIQTNGVGVVDGAYSGDEDVWKMPVYAMNNGRVFKGDRICQFRIIEKQPTLDIVTTDVMPTPSRGGFGSTGIK